MTLPLVSVKGSLGFKKQLQPASGQETSLWKMAGGGRVRTQSVK